jgi:hypothetical protein
VVPPRLTLSSRPLEGMKQKSLPVMQQGGKASVTLFRYAAGLRLYPCPITGAPELGYLVLDRELSVPTRSPFQLGGPFGFCAFAWLTPCGHSRPRAKLAGNRFEAYSSSSTFLVYVGRDSMTDGVGCQEDEGWCVSPDQNCPFLPKLTICQSNRHGSILGSMWY